MLFRYVQRNTGADEAAAKSLARELGVTPITAAVLIGRGIASPEAGQRFFGCGVESLRDPMGLLDMDKAVQRIRRAVESGERITVYGDYDVDGVCSTAILVGYLRAIGGTAVYYIPSRHKEGYGVNAAAIESLQGTRLLITVDCGISNGAELMLANELGMDVIVTDHHECPDVLPRCVAVVNPKRSGQAYGFTGLCGAGVVLKLVQALGGAAEAEKVSDLAAMATVADIVPLTDENLAIVRMGLARINAGGRPGIQALREVAGLAGKPVKSGHIGFALGPRINAGGRMDISSKSVDMLLTQDRTQADAIARSLDGDNRERVLVEEQILTEAVEMVESSYSFREDRAIVLYQPHWNTGVTGIVASRMVERYHRPTILFGQGGRGQADDPTVELVSSVGPQRAVTETQEPAVLCYGSGRSVPGVHLYRAMKACDGFFTRYGGHEQAAGCALLADRLDGFRAALNRHLAQTYEEDIFLPLRYYDAEITISELTRELAQDMERLEPAGFGNPRPVFLLRNAAIGGLNRTADGKHLRMRLGPGGIEGIAFRQGDAMLWLQGLKACDVLAVPDINSFQGRERVQALVEHIRPPQGAEALAALLVQPAVGRSPLWSEQTPTVSYRPVEETEGLALLTETVKRSHWGVLALCFTRHSAARVFAALDQQDCAQSIYAGLGTAPQARRGENAVVLFPDAAKLPIRRYGTVFLFDGALGAAFGAAEAKQLNNDGNRVIIKVNHVSDAGSGGFDRKDLLELYQAMKAALATAAPQYPGDWRALGGKVSPWQAEVAARIFCELGLLRELDKSPWLIEEKPKARADLNESITYRLLQHDANSK